MPTLFNFVSAELSASWDDRRGELADKAREWLMQPMTAGIAAEMLKLLDGIDMAIKADDVNRAVVLASHLGAAYKAGQLSLWVLADLVNAPVVSRETKRQQQQRKKAGEQKTARQQRVALAKKLLSEYSAADLKGNRKAIYRVIGKVMQHRFGLDKPLSASTIRSYLLHCK